MHCILLWTAILLLDFFLKSFPHADCEVLEACDSMLLWFCISCRVYAQTSHIVDTQQALLGRMNNENRTIYGYQSITL